MDSGPALQEDPVRPFRQVGTSEHADYQGFIDDVKVPVLTKSFDMADLPRIAREILAVL